MAPPALESRGFGRAFWVYLAVVALIGAGYADFALVAYHFGTAGIVGPPLIPVLYAVAMASDAVAALAHGRLFDRWGRVVVIGDGLPAVVPGMLLWGIGLGTQESVMRAVVARMAPPDRRGTAYGVLNAVFGLVWFGGSAMLGILYDQSVAAVALVPLLLQLAAVPLALLLATLKWTQPR